jgi:hypothetical protein
MKPTLIFCLALVLSGVSIVSHADETNDAPTKPNLVMTLSANGVTNNSVVAVEGTNISGEITNVVANFGKFILSSTNLPPTNFTSALPTMAATAKTNFEQGFTKLQELAVPAGQFLVKLKEQGRLPGVPTDSHGQMTAGGLHLSELNSGYPFAVTFLLVMNGDTLTNHYTVMRAAADADWQLQRAWRTDAEGNTILEWPVK